MTFARPLFLVALLAGIASSAVAADKSEQSKIPSNSIQSVANASTFVTPALEQPSGLIYSVAKAQTPGQPTVSEPPIAKLDDDVCYTLRMYRVKRAEHLADGESGLRGYSTCEMATKYQYRSAVAHPRTVDESTRDPQK
jgi:hypothetical protein